MMAADNNRKVSFDKKELCRLGTRLGTVLVFFLNNR